MTCHYHPERESTDKCAICGKPICKECGLEIAGKIYCKDCLQKIVGIGLEENEGQPEEEPIITETEYSEPEDIYSPQEEVANVQQKQDAQEYQKINEDSPYNIKDNINAGHLESSYISEESPKAAQVENNAEPEAKIVEEDPDAIYPDHSYQPEPTSARLDLEDKYEKYLDDLYFDEVPLEEQLAKDEEKFGSLTKKPKPEEPPIQKQEGTKPQKVETPEEMEARIRAEILKERGMASQVEENSEKNIHNLNYKEEKEPMGAVDIILTVILIIVILIVIYYLIYLFILHNSYPTFMDALFGLKNPQNIINNLLSSNPK